MVGSWGYREADPSRSSVSVLRQPKAGDKCCSRERHQVPAGLARGGTPRRAGGMAR